MKFFATVLAAFVASASASGECSMDCFHDCAESVLNVKPSFISVRDCVRDNCHCHEAVATKLDHVVTKIHDHVEARLEDKAEHLAAQHPEAVDAMHHWLSMS